MRDWKEFVESNGYVFVESTNKDVIFNVDGFYFKVNKYKFPPKKLAIRQCLTPTEYCIHRFNLKHNNYYTYDHFSWKDKVSDYGVFTCPIHGNFNQIINGHLRGQGCFKCFGAEKLTVEDVVTRCVEARGYKYDYSNLKYDNKSNKITLSCRKHGEFSTNLYHHLKGVDCKLCSISESIGNYISSEDFESKAKLVHGDKYDYSLVEYKGAKTKINIVCKQHGSFMQTPNDHLSGNGCQLCGLEKMGYTRTAYINACKDSGSYLYVLHISSEQEDFYKIGISKDISARIRGIVCESGYAVSLVYSYHDSAEVIFDLEKYLHRRYNKLKVKPKIKFAGYTECFSNISIKDIEKDVKTIYN